MLPSSNCSLWSGLDRISRRLLELIVLLSSASVVLSLFYLVLARYVFNWSSAGMHTISLVSAMWLYMTGALVASKNRQHLVIDYTAQKITNHRLKIFHALFISILQFLISCIITYWVWRMFIWGNRFSSSYPDFNLPLWVGQAAIGVNAIGNLVYLIRDICLSYIELKKSKAS